MEKTSRASKPETRYVPCTESPPASTWLHQVTRNTVLMSLRKKRLKETSLEEIMGSDNESGRRWNWVHAIAALRPRLIA